MPSKNKKVAMSLILAPSLLAIGCNSSTNEDARDGSASGGDGWTASDAGAGATDGSSGTDTSTTTLYQRLGRHAGIRGALDKIIQAELGDPDIASFFVAQATKPTPAGHPTLDQLAECLTDQLGNAAGGPEVYPTTVSDDAGSWTCRDMATIHRSLHISGGTFDKFVMIAAGELQTLGVATADIQTVGGVLNSTKTAIVDPHLVDAGSAPFDAGADSATTLYQRLGAHGGIRAALNQVVAAELGDPDIASYFFNQMAAPTPAGHPNVSQLEECLTDQLGNAAGGPETYPTTVSDDAGSWTCRDMITIHQPLHISGGTFDKFVMIAASELQILGVALADIQTIGGVLTSTKPAIVDPSVADAGPRPYDAGGQ